MVRGRRGWEKITQKKDGRCQPLQKNSLFLLALRIPACRADVAALLVDEHIATIGALPGQVLGQTVVLHLGLIITADMLFQDAGDGIGAGEDRLALLPGDGRAADAAELLHHRGNIHPGPQCQRDEAADSLKLGRGTTAGLTQTGEHLADATLIRVNGYVDITTAGSYSFGYAGGYL
jgi:hypothetical protein